MLSRASGDNQGNTCHHRMWFYNRNGAVRESRAHSKLPIDEEETHFLRTYRQSGFVLSCYEIVKGLGCADPVMSAMIQFFQLIKYNNRQLILISKPGEHGMDAILDLTS